MIGTRRDPNIVRSTIPEAKVRWLGRHGGYDYATYAGSEYAVEPGSIDNPQDFTRQPGELLVMRIAREVIDGSPFEHHRTHRAFRVNVGTYERLAAKGRRPIAEKPMRPWDALAGLAAMRRREPVRVPFTVSPATLAADFKAQLQPAALGFVEAGGHEPPDRSPAGIVAYLVERGIELSLVRGRLLARSRTPIKADHRELIETAHELIVGHLRGQPTICSSCAEPAIGVAFPDAPMCAAHLEARY